MNGRHFLDSRAAGARVSPPTSPARSCSRRRRRSWRRPPVGSQRNFSNNFIVDGLSANDDAAGLSGIPYGVDAVDQFQVVTSGGQAELGRALGGYINVVTKSGTNAPRGDIYAYVRDDRFNAPNALSATPCRCTDQYGGASAGPSSAIRTFYFRMSSSEN